MCNYGHKNKNKITTTTMKMTIKNFSKMMMTTAG